MPAGYRRRQVGVDLVSTATTTEAPGLSHQPGRQPTSPFWAGRYDRESMAGNG
ncbi:hypothetical protein SEA_LYSIDIOUS_34 [Gordonia phage Lysidious]|nr:hypothetical protein SEA_LYSIDIOUS_34 [Gordonia phage Lysidious]